MNDKSKERYKVKVNNIEGHDPYQIKKEELSDNISEFPPVTNLDIANFYCTKVWSPTIS